MWKSILLFIFFSTSLYSQDNLIGKKEITVYENGSFKKKTVLNPLPNTGTRQFIPTENSSQPLSQLNNTNVRWFYTDPTAIGSYCQTSGNGKYNVVGWDLNSERVSLYGNLNSTPIWEFVTNPEVYLNFVTISDTGGVIGVGSYYNV